MACPTCPTIVNVSICNLQIVYLGHPPTTPATSKPLQVTVDYFGEGVRPDQVFVSATVDPASAFADACIHLGISTIPCRVHRLKSAVMRALGLEGDDRKPKNAAMKGLVGKCSTLLGIFSNSAVDNDALRDQTTGKHKPVGRLHHSGSVGVGSAQHSDPEKPFETRCALIKVAVDSFLPLLRVECAKIFARLPSPRFRRTCGCSPGLVMGYHTTNQVHNLHRT